MSHVVSYSAEQAPRSFADLQSHTFSKRGFTLVELLVAVGIIAVLVAIILPALGTAKRQARSLACIQNQKNLFSACLMFANDNRGNLPVPSTRGDGPTDPVVIAKGCWAMDKSGVANHKVGVIWKYIPTLEARRDLIWCPDDNAEFQEAAGGRTDIDRNFSYSFNANIRGGSEPEKREFYPLRNVARPSERVYIFEETGPNDAYCSSPHSNIDDRVTGRHGKVDSLQYGSAGYFEAGKGNYCFFDGHVETLTPDQFFRNPGYYGPLK